MVLEVLSVVFRFCRLIVAARHQPAPIVLSLVELLATSRPVVVFSAQLEVRLSVRFLQVADSHRRRPFYVAGAFARSGLVRSG